MAEIANAWISIVPDTSKIAPGIKKAFGEVEAPVSAAGKSIGEKFSATIGKSLKVGAASIGVAAGGVLAGSIAKGMGRLTAIEGAKAKLTGLGNSAEAVSGIMDNALSSVKGTAHGLGEAATSASMLVAAGVKQGEQLETTLKTVGDVAAISGRSMADMGTIFGSVAARGKLQGDDMLQLMSSGVPVLQLLADELGKTSGEVSEMVSKGQIDFETFERAMRAGMGGAALEMGNTFQGALANMGAAMGRFGEGMLKPFFNSAPALMTSFGKVFDSMTDSLKPAGEKLEAALTPAFTSLGSVIETKVAPAAGVAAGKIADLVASLAEKAVDPALWERIGEAFAKVRDMVGQAWPHVKEFATAWSNAAANVSAATWQALTDVLNALAPVISDVVVPALNKVAEIAREHPALIGGVVTAFLGMKGLGVLTAPLAGVASALMGVGKVFVMMKFAKHMAQLSAATAVTNPALSAFAGMAGNLTKAMNPFGTVLQFVLSPAKALFSLLLKSIPRLLGVINPWVGALMLAAGALTWFFTKTETGQRLWSGFVNTMKAGVGWIKDGFATVWDYITEKYQRFVDRISQGIDRIKGVFDTIKTAWEEIKIAFTGGDWGYGALDSLIGEDKAQAVVNTFAAIGQAFEFFKQQLAIVGEIVTLAWEQIKAAFTTGIEIVKAVFANGWEQVKNVFSTIWLVIVALVTGKWGEIPAILSAGWEAIKTTFFEGVDRVKEILGGFIENSKARFQEMWSSVTELFSNVWGVIQNGWNSLVEFLRGAWENIKTTFSNAVNAIISTVVGWVTSIVAKFQELRNAVIAKAIEIAVSVPAKFTEMKNKAIQTVQEMPGKIKGFFSGAKSWLINAGRDILQGLWDGLKEKFAAIEGWLSSAKSKITGVFSGITSSASSQINYSGGGGGRVARRARGGRLPTHGPGTGTVDGILGVTDYGMPIARVNAGEYVVNAHATKAFLPLLDAINGGHVNPSDPASGLQRLRDGGIVNPHDLLRFAKGENVAGKQAPRSLEGASYVWGGGLLGNWGDCSGAMSGLAAAVTGVPLAGRKFATGSEGGWLSQHGFKSGLGSGARFAVGFFNGGSYGGHTSGTIFFGDGKRVNVEMGGGRGNGQIGGAAAGADHSQYTDRFHFPLNAGAAAGAAAAVAAGATPTSTSTQGMTLTGGKSIEWGEASNLFSEVQKNRKMSAAMARWKSGAFDQGGVANGLGFMPKATIKPERVLNPSNTKSFDKLPGVLADVANKMGISAEAQAMAARAGNNIAAAVNNVSASQVLSYGEKLGLGDFTNLAKGSVSAWESVEKSLVAQVDAADGVKQAEDNLKVARAEYAQAMAEDTELTVQQKRRLEDAMKAVSDAKRPDSKGKVNADRVAKAELKLERVREDIAAEQEKAGKKQSDTAKKAAENLLKAESDLADARGVVAAAATAAGHAEIAFALEVVDMVLKIADKIIGAVMNARAVVANAVHSAMESVGQLVDMTVKLREQVAFAALEQAEAQIKMNAAARGIRMAQFDGVRSQLEAAKTVAEAQAKFDAQRKADMRAAMLNYEDLSLAMDRWRWAMHNGISESLDGMVAWSDASHALWAELQAATIGRQIAEKQAQVNTLKAVYEHQKAALDLQEATTALSVASQKLAVMAGKAFGYDNVQATVGSRYTELMAEKAKLQADQASIKTWINPINWFTSMPAATGRIEQINRELAELAKLPEFKQFTPDQLREIERIQASAGAMGFFGAGDKVESMIKNSSLGDAARALDRAKFEHELIDAKNATTIARQKLDAKKAEVDYSAQVAPIEALIDQLKSKQESEKTWAEYWREEDSQVREALARLAKFQADAAASMNANLNDPKVIQLVGDKFDADTLEKALGELGVRVEKLERPTNGSASVVASRR